MSYRQHSRLNPCVSLPVNGPNPVASDRLFPQLPPILKSRATVGRGMATRDLRILLAGFEKLMPALSTNPVSVVIDQTFMCRVTGATIEQLYGVEDIVSLVIEAVWDTEPLTNDRPASEGSLVRLFRSLDAELESAMSLQDVRAGKVGLYAR